MSVLSGIYGNNLICERLYRAVKENKIFNSYIFEGARGSGRKTLAINFSAAIVCKNKQDKLPCGECDACRKVFSRNHPDVLFIEREKGKKTIGVDVIRESVINNIYIKPLVSDRKIVIIADGGSLTEQSQNALLKVLEEPPEYVSFIIITENAGKLLQTVLSRSVTISLMPVNDSVVKKVLSEKTEGNYSEQEITFAAKFARGIVGKGLEILENEEFSKIYKETAKQLFALFGKKSSVGSFEKYLTDEKENIDLIINFVLVLLRDFILIKLGRENLVICENYIYDIKKISEDVGIKELNIASELVLEYKEKLDRNAGFLSATMDMLLKLSEQLNKENKG